MKKHETVRRPLTPNEIFELGITALQQLPRNLDPDKVRADLGSKGTLGRDLRKFFYDRYAALSFDIEPYARYYRDVFGKTVDLSVLSVPEGPTYKCWPIVVVPGLVTNNERFDASKKLFGNAWRYVDDLNTVRDIVTRPKTPYVVYVKATVEADPDLASVSAEAIEQRALNVLTLGERLDLGLQHHYFFGGEHLDVENVTLCAGSRCADGDVPFVFLSPAGRKLYVDACDVRYASPPLRARAAVVPAA